VVGELAWVVADHRVLARHQPQPPGTHGGGDHGATVGQRLHHLDAGAGTTQERTDHHRCLAVEGVELCHAAMGAGNATEPDPLATGTHHRQLAQATHERQHLVAEPVRRLPVGCIPEVGHVQGTPGLTRLGARFGYVHTVRHHVHRRRDPLADRLGVHRRRHRQHTGQLGHTTLQSFERRGVRVAIQLSQRHLVVVEVHHQRHLALHRQVGGHRRDGQLEGHPPGPAATAGRSTVRGPSRPALVRPAVAAVRCAPSSRASEAAAATPRCAPWPRRPAARVGGYGEAASLATTGTTTASKLPAASCSASHQRRARSDDPLPTAHGSNAATSSTRRSASGLLVLANEALVHVEQCLLLLLSEQRVGGDGLAHPTRIGIRGEETGPLVQGLGADL
jgi:hypothetical protein